MERKQQDKLTSEISYLLKVNFMDINEIEHIGNNLAKGIKERQCEYVAMIIVEIIKGLKENYLKDKQIKL